MKLCIHVRGKLLIIVFKKMKLICALKMFLNKIITVTYDDENT